MTYNGRSSPPLHERLHNLLHNTQHSSLTTTTHRTPPPTSSSATRRASQPVAMSTVIPNNPLAAHLFQDPRLSPAHSDALHQHTMSGRKRKADEELDNERSNNDRMSTSPTASPSIQHRGLPAHRTIKRTRTHTSAGRPLPLPRLLQTLSADELRNLVQNICNERPDIRETIVTKAPRPSVESTLAVLAKYENDLREAFPLGNRTTSDYAYNRVRHNLLQLIEALRDYTPYYLPPQETQTGLSLTYLDAVTNMIHRLPDWDTYQNQRHKNEAYDEIGRAWALVIREAAKTAGGFRLQLGNWDQKLVEHNNRSGGRMAEAVSDLQGAMGYTQPGPSTQPAAQPTAMDQRAAIRQQLLSGTYGAPELGVGPGQW